MTKGILGVQAVARISEGPPNLQIWARVMQKPELLAS